MFKQISIYSSGWPTDDDEEGRHPNPQPQVGRQSEEEAHQRFLQTVRPEVRLLHCRHGWRWRLPLQSDVPVLRSSDGSPVYVLGHHGFDGRNGIDGRIDGSQRRSGSVGSEFVRAFGDFVKYGFVGSASFVLRRRTRFWRSRDLKLGPAVEHGWSVRLNRRNRKLKKAKLKNKNNFFIICVSLFVWKTCRAVPAAKKLKKTNKRTNEQQKPKINFTKVTPNT